MSPTDCFAVSPLVFISINLLSPPQPPLMSLIAKQSVEYFILWVFLLIYLTFLINTLKIIKNDNEKYFPLFAVF